ncbi:MAG: CAP domain-containing protein [Acidobacteriaceae bacterium]
MNLSFPALLLLSFLAAAAVPPCLPAQSTDAVPADAEHLLTMTNQARAADNLGPLHWDAALADAAHRHAALMVEHAALSHQFADEPTIPARAAQAGAHFAAIAENIALGPNAVTIQKEWMQSVQHRTNILDPKMDAIGIGLLRAPNGELYAVEDFAQTVDSLSPAAAEARVIALLRQNGIAAASSTQDARQTCEMAHGTAGGSQPAFVMRWQGADLSRLPDVLVQHMRTGHFRSAAVGACDSAHPPAGFTTYRVAVLLY